MPEISRFLGIVITMYFNDHNPPHFHVRYENARGIVGIDPLELREGELRQNWTTLAEKGIFNKIDPLV